MFFMKTIVPVLIVLSSLALPAAAQLNPGNQTSTSVTLVTDTTDDDADTTAYAIQPAPGNGTGNAPFDELPFAPFGWVTPTFLLGLLAAVAVIAAIVAVLHIRTRRRLWTQTASQDQLAKIWFWRQQNRAIRLGAIGVGLVVFGCFVHAAFSIGLGCLLVCIGGGNFWIARRNRMLLDEKEEINEETICNNTTNCSDVSSTKES